LENGSFDSFSLPFKTQQSLVKGTVGIWLSYLIIKEPNEGYEPYKNKKAPLIDLGRPYRIVLALASSLSGGINYAELSNLL